MRNAIPHGSGREDQARNGELERFWFEQWDGHHGDLMRLACTLLGGDAHAAEDIIQETAIRLWQHPEVMDDDRPLGGWLRTVARHLVTDQVRRRRARPTECALTAGVDGESRGDFERIESAESVHRMLSPLSPPQRAVVLEVYVHDRPVAEVATRLGIPVGTVKSRCHTALRQLRGSPACLAEAVNV